jgi:hypothetical protein
MNQIKRVSRGILSRIELFLLLIALMLNAPFIYATEKVPGVTKEYSATNYPPGTPLTLESVFTPAISSHLFVPGAVTYTFSSGIGGQDDAINRISFCLGGNATCSTCNVPTLTLTAGTPLPYTLAGTTYGISPDAINAYLNASGFLTGTYYIGLDVQSQDFTCNTLSAYCSTNLDSTAQPLCIEAQYDSVTPGNTTLTRIDSGTAELTIAKTLYAYVSDGSGSVYQCAVDAAGELSGTCTATSSLNGAHGITFGVSSDGTVNAYVATNTANAYRCTVNPATGALNGGSCVAVIIDAGIEVGGVTIAASGQGNFLYVTSVDPGNVYRCQLAADGSFTTGDCSTTGTPPGGLWQGPASLNFGLTKLTSTTYPQFAYIPGVQGPNGKISKCPYAPDTNTLGACTETPISSAPLWTPSSIVISAVNNNWYAYVGTSGGVLYVCDYDITTGELNGASCGQTPSVPPSGWAPYSIASATVSGVLYGYVASPGGDRKVYKCTIDVSGGITNADFTSCSETPSSAAPWTLPLNITFAYF